MTTSSSPRTSPAGPSRGRASTARQRGAYDRIRQAIVSGELRPGDPLVETALADWCQVSRTPIREALTRLEQDGIVVRTDRGLCVREDSPEDVGYEEADDGEGFRYERAVARQPRHRY